MSLDTNMSLENTSQPGRPGPEELVPSRYALKVVAAATTLSAAMLHLTLDTSSAAARDVKDRLEQLVALPNPGD
jgi:hypothetical protein